MGLYLAGFMSRIAEYSYMTINFLLYFHALYHFRSYWNGKMNKTIGVFYLLLLIVNTLIAASIILPMITYWLVYPGNSSPFGVIKCLRFHGP